MAVEEKVEDLKKVLKREITERKKVERILEQQSQELFLAHENKERSDLKLKVQNEVLKQNINERDEIKKELVLFKYLLHNSNDAIFLLQPQSGRFTYVNAKACEKLKYTEEELLTKHVIDVDVNIPNQKEWNKVLSTIVYDKKMLLETSLRSRDGSTFQAEVSANYVTRDQNEYIVAVVRDITKRKEIEYELKKNHDDLRKMHEQLKEHHHQLIQSEKLASIGQLVAGVAHEINSPIGYIMSNLRVLDDYIKVFHQQMNHFDELLQAINENNSDIKKITNNIKKFGKEHDIKFILEDSKELLEETQDGAIRIRDFVNCLKNFSRVDDDDDFEEANIIEGIESTLRVVWNELKYKCTIEKNYEKIPNLYCNIGQLKQVFMNLFLNAAHAIKDEGKISISTKKIGNKIEIAISDTGCGIDENIQDKIFNPFYTTKKHGEGTGLGLSISKGIINNHNGEIIVHSKKNEGATFKVLLPIEQ